VTDGDPTPGDPTPGDATPSDATTDGDPTPPSPTPGQTPVTWPGATTRQVVLLGDPVEHSRSPQLHNTAFRHHGLDLAYLALRVAGDDLGSVVAGLGASGCAGANVTVPHKQAAHELCDVLSAEADLVGAVNTLWWDRGRLHGTTTDATGLARALAADVGELVAAEVLLLGTGGAARAAAVAFARAGVRLTVAGRRSVAAHEVAAVAVAAGGAATAFDLADHDRLAAAVAASRLVCNATSVGMHGERLPDPVAAIGAGQVAYDLVYGVPRTPFLAAAAANGAAVHDGRAMLVAQAEDAFAVWTGEIPEPGLFAATMAGLS
jgi:shikimate dehydrogenase